MSKQVTEKQIENSLKPSRVRAFFNKNLTKRFKKQDCNSCALARYLQSDLKVNRHEVKVKDGDVHVKGIVTFLPDWAVNFVILFDEQKTKYVTGKKSLQILLDVAYRTA